MSPPPRGRERLPDYDELLAMYTRNKIHRPVSQQPAVSKRATLSQQVVRKAGTSALRMDQYYNEESEEEDDDGGMEIDDLPPQTTKFLGRTIQTKQQPSNMFRRVQNPTAARAYVEINFSKTQLIIQKNQRNRHFTQK